MKLSDGRGWLAGQIIFVAALSGLLTYFIRYSSPWNVIWILALPLLLGVTLNRSPLTRAPMALLLPSVSLIAVCVVGEVMSRI
jgi:hypothetical protein